MLFKVVKRYYNMGLYSNDDIAVFVRAGKLSTEEYQLITGEEYVQ